MLTSTYLYLSRCRCWSVSTVFVSEPVDARQYLFVSESVDAWQLLLVAESVDADKYLQYLYLSQYLLVSKSVDAGQDLTHYDVECHPFHSYIKHSSRNYTIQYLSNFYVYFFLNLPVRQCI